MCRSLEATHKPQLLIQVEVLAQALAGAGITALWLPPAGKGLAGRNDVGYGIYDPYDLGEFDQRGGVATKYGTRAEYLAAVAACRAAGLQIDADAVFNHLMGDDAEEEFNATPHDPQSRFQPLGDQRRIRGWTHYSYPARAGAHSAMQWHWWHFDAVDYNSLEPDLQAVWRIEGKAFDDDVDLERGDYDYLMGCDLDIDHPEVRDALKHWGTWMLDTLRWYASRSGGRIHLFDVPLHHNFHVASTVGHAAVKYADLSTNRITNYQFSCERMLALTGNTAPYLLYAVVRIAGIARKGGDLATGVGSAAPGGELLKLDAVIAEVESELLPNRLCSYLFELSQVFNRFYDQVPVLKAEEPARSSRLALCRLTAGTLKLGLGLLGIPTLERM
jgi:hypothetical protein